MTRDEHPPGSFGQVREQWRQDAEATLARFPGWVRRLAGILGRGMQWLAARRARKAEGRADGA